MRRDDGFSLFVVMMVLLACGMFVAAGYAAAQGDLPLSGRSQDRKEAFAAAEAGVNFYQFHLNQDSDYWLRCTNVPGPSPVTQEGAADPRWRNVPGAAAQYTIELLHQPGWAGCVEGEGESMLDANGLFRIRVTGRPSQTSSVRRSIIATFRRVGFLDFLYFTNRETLDPSVYSERDRDDAQEYCDQPRSQRDAVRWRFSCTEIRFVTGDEVKGPLHSNDSLLICGSPTFGRPGEYAGKDRITVFQADPPDLADRGCSNDATYNSPLRVVEKSVDPPPSNLDLLELVQPEYHYRGKTTIHFDAVGHPGQMQVTNPYLNGGQPQWMTPPSNGVVYVDRREDTSCTTDIPTSARYRESDACANLYVDGAYDTSLTLAAANDIIIKPAQIKTWGPSLGELRHTSDTAVMGLVANNFVRVYHPCSSNRNLDGYMEDVRIDAAILALQHSFIVDNYACGRQLDKLTVNGAMAQYYRGVVGTSGGTGYIKDYNYDDRLKYRTPPHFLEPTSSSWQVLRFNEQVNAPPR